MPATSANWKITKLPRTHFHTWTLDTYPPIGIFSTPTSYIKHIQIYLFYYDFFSHWSKDDIWKDFVNLSCMCTNNPLEVYNSGMFRTHWIHWWYPLDLNLKLWLYKRWEGWKWCKISYRYRFLSFYKRQIRYRYQFARNFKTVAPQAEAITHSWNLAYM